MSAEEQEVTLVMESYDLPALELGQGRKERLKHPTDRVSESRNKIVQNELGVMRRCTGMSLGIQPQHLLWSRLSNVRISAW
jgi:hypothetical protein